MTTCMYIYVYILLLFTCYSLFYRDTVSSKPGGSVSYLKVKIPTMFLVLSTLFRGILKGEGGGL